jgi:hypothetical protein
LGILLPGEKDLALRWVHAHPSVLMASQSSLLLSRRRSGMTRPCADTAVIFTNPQLFKWLQELDFDVATIAGTSYRYFRRYCIL